LESHATEKPFHVTHKRDKLLSVLIGSRDMLKGIGGPTQSARQACGSAGLARSLDNVAEESILAAFSFGPNQSASQVVIVTVP
jgi:hypothetical protein